MLEQRRMRGSADIVPNTQGTFCKNVLKHHNTKMIYLKLEIHLWTTFFNAKELSLLFRHLNGYY